jgi:hypothetical protein
MAYLAIIAGFIGFLVVGGWIVQLLDRPKWLKHLNAMERARDDQRKR